ncbi:MAG: cell surface protein, partial [Muribaculaceae bacterium]|nr:cell surface protein [Muribaculaceae bacterium]
MKRIFTLFLAGVSLCAAAQNSPYISKVYDFLPAPGQFVNELPEYMDGDTHEAILAKVEEQICGDKNPGMISLGAFGGYVVFGFDHPVANVEGAYDFKIYANAFMAAGSSAGGSCEPGIVMVSVDANGNGLADDEWYELAGSDYGKETTIKNYSITYYKPDADKTPTADGMITDSTYIRWTSSEGDEGYVMKNSFHNQSYWPEWYEGETMEFIGTKLADNAFDQSGNGSYYVLTRLDWGYADNYANDIDEGFKIDWAVDAQGN